MNNTSALSSIWRTWWLVRRSVKIRGWGWLLFILALTLPLGSSLALWFKMKSLNPVFPVILFIHGSYLAILHSRFFLQREYPMLPYRKKGPLILLIEWTSTVLQLAAGGWIIHQISPGSIQLSLPLLLQGIGATLLGWLSWMLVRRLGPAAFFFALIYPFFHPEGWWAVVFALLYLNFMVAAVYYTLLGHPRFTQCQNRKSPGPGRKKVRWLFHGTMDAKIEAIARWPDYPALKLFSRLLVTETSWMLLLTGCITATNLLIEWFGGDLAESQPKWMSFFFTSAIIRIAFKFTSHAFLENGLPHLMVLSRIHWGRLLIRFRLTDHLATLTAMTLVPLLFSQTLIPLLGTFDYKGDEFLAYLVVLSLLVLVVNIMLTVLSFGKSRPLFSRPGNGFRMGQAPGTRHNAMRIAIFFLTLALILAGAIWAIVQGVIDPSTWVSPTGISVLITIWLILNGASLILWQSNQRRAFSEGDLIS